MTHLTKREVLATLRVEAVLAHFQVEGRRGATEFRANRCPRCGPRSTPAVTISLETGRWKCHGHGHQGDVLDLVAGFAGLSTSKDFPAVLARASAISGVPAPVSPAPVAPIVAPPAAVLAELWATLPPVAGAAVALLRERGLVALLERHDLVRGSPTAPLGTSPWARAATALLRPTGLVVPSYALADGALCNLTCRRAVPGSGPKIVSLPAVAKSNAGVPRGTFGSWASFATHPRDVVLVEGLVDYLTAVLQFPECVVLGAEGSDLLAGVVRVISPAIGAAGCTLTIVPHRDEAGAQALRAAVDAACDVGVAPGAGLRILDVAPHKDLNDAWTARLPPAPSVPVLAPEGPAPPLVLPRHEATPSQLAEHFARRELVDRDGRCQIVRWAGQWHRYEEGRYVEAPKEWIEARLWRFLHELRVTTTSATGERVTAPYVATHERVVGVRRGLLRQGLLPAAEVPPPHWLEDDPGWDARATLPCPNAIVHLRDLAVRAPTPALFNLQRLAVDYEPTAAPPRAWLAFLDEVFAGERVAIETVQRLFGYLLTPDTRLHKLFLLVGPRRSGKGTIGRVLHALLGPRQLCAPGLAELERPFGLAPLVGKSLAIIGDARLEGRRVAQELESRLLSLSGEDDLDIARKYLPTITLRPTVRVLIISNAVPQFVDASGALASRFVILRTRRSFLGREDLALRDRLHAELPGILNWAISGWQALEATGLFPTPASTAADHAELDGLASPLRRFIDDCLHIQRAAEVSSAALYEVWRRWCIRNGHAYPGSIQHLGRDLRAVLPEVELVQRRASGTRARVYRGVGLRPIVAS